MSDFVILADLLPPELTAIRAGGLIVALGLAVYAIVRRRQLRNADVLILLVAALGLAIVAGTEIPDILFSACCPMFTAYRLLPTAYSPQGVHSRRAAGRDHDHCNPGRADHRGGVQGNQYGEEYED